MIVPSTAVGKQSKNRGELWAPKGKRTKKLKWLFQRQPWNETNSGRIGSSLNAAAISHLYKKELCPVSMIEWITSSIVAYVKEYAFLSIKSLIEEMWDVSWGQGKSKIMRGFALYLPKTRPSGEMR